ncbi:MAG: ArsB/NhaD family transporter [bacterium]
MTINYIVSISIFLLLFIFICTEKIHKTIVSMICAALMVIFGIFRGFYSPDKVMQAIDFNTLGLLIGMMIIVNHLKQTGIFNYLSIKLSKLSKGNSLYLFIFLTTITAIISMWIDNVTTLILIGPITILITNTLGISSLPFLIGEAFLSNIGGAGTMIGDPPNIIIGSESGLSFNSFIVHLMPPTIIMMIVTIIVFCIIFRKEFEKNKKNIEHIMSMDEYEAIKKSKGLKRCAIVLLITIALFFLHQKLEIPLSFIAFFGASLLLLLMRPNLEEILQKVEWPSLFFFMSLFIIVGGIENTGLLKIIGAKILPLAQTNIVLCAIYLFWISIILSAITNNISFTIAIVPIIKHISITIPNANILWWALALGAAFGANGTPIGSTANIIAISISEKTKYPITFKNWIKYATFPLFIGCIVISLILLCFPNLFN